MAASPGETELAPEPAAWICRACEEKLHRTRRLADSADAEEEDEKVLGELEKTMTEEERLSRQERALKLKEKGNIHFKWGQYADAVESYTEALKTCPLSLPAVRSILYLSRVLTWLQLGENKLAIKDCSKAIKLNPSNMKAILTRARLNEGMGSVDEALKDYKRALELDPSNEEAMDACRFHSRKTGTNNHENRQNARTADRMKEQEEQRLRKEKIRKFCTGAGIAALCGLGAVVAAPVVVAAAGFGAGGVTAGSVAAFIHSKISCVTVGATAAGVAANFYGRQAQSPDATKGGNEEKENQKNRRQEEATHGPDGVKCQRAKHIGRNCEVTRCAWCGHYIHSADVAGGTGDKGTPRGKV